MSKLPEIRSIEVRGKVPIDDYLNFRREWQKCISPNYDEVIEIALIKKRVPLIFEIALKNVNTMESVWKILDYDYGLEMKQKLRSFVPAGKIIAEKFTKLFKVYTEVKDILIEFGRL